MPPGESATVKPKLRGVVHQYAALVALGGGAVLTVMAPSSRSMLACGVYAATLAMMLGASALYHRITWSPNCRLWMRRADHAGIFLVIAGTYTPFSMLTGLPDEDSRVLLRRAWMGAALGIVQSLLLVDYVPRGVGAALYVGLGWQIVSVMGALRQTTGTAELALLVAGGILYSLGAVVYALKRPDPWPWTFGFHEVFHTLVVAAAACHFSGVVMLVHRADGSGCGK